MEDITIESLIAQRRVVTLSDLSNPANDYMVVGVYQNGTNRMRGDGTSYKNYVISIAELVGGGGSTPITLNVIPQGSGPSIVDGKWAFSGNDIYPIANCSNIGLPANRIQTIYMCSSFDYLTDLTWISTTEKMRLTAAGELLLGTTSPSGQFIYAQKNQDIFTNGLIENTNTHVDASAGWVAQSDSVTLFLGAGSSINSNFPNSGAVGTVDSNLFIAAGISGTPKDIIFVSGGTSLADEKMRILSTGNVGIGTATPLAKLHVQDNIDGAGSGIPNIYFATSVGGILHEYNSVTGTKIVFNEGVNVRGAFSNTGGFSQLHSQHRFTLKDNGNISKLWMDSVNGYIGIGSAYFAASAQLHVQGDSAAYGTYAFKSDNLSGAPLLYIDNSSFVGIGIASPTSQLHLYRVAFSNGIEVRADDNAYLTLRGATNNTIQFLNHSGEQPLQIQGIIGFGGYIKVKDNFGVGNFVNNVAIFRCASVDTYPVWAMGNQLGGTILEANTRFVIYGQNVLATDYALKVKDGNGGGPVDILMVRNDGQIAIPLVQTGNAGLVAGDLYVDSAANILANGDLVVGRKV